jgi:arginyl-tRNA--protein-N-Asp/Glu arginylyltransferase
MNTPELITGKVLDDYLARGYYRSGQVIFTDCICFGGVHAYEVFWLRTLLNGQSDYERRTVFKKNKGFEVQIKDVVINEEIEHLFQKYTSQINFETSDSVFEYLLGFEEPKAIFNTKTIEVRSEGKLIAVGYFDEGENAIAAILHFYHPDYKHHSLGKYLMLLSMQYASQRKMQYYYTGYIALGFNKFDYKTYPDEKLVEVFLPDLDSWGSFSEIGKEGLNEHSFLKEIEGQ